MGELQIGLQELLDKFFADDGLLVLNVKAFRLNELRHQRQQFILLIVIIYHEVVSRQIGNQLTLCKPAAQKQFRDALVESEQHVADVDQTSVHLKWLSPFLVILEQYVDQ